MNNIIRKGDKTTGGGTVLSGSATMKFGGLGAARKGDPVLCPVPGHGQTVIAEGNGGVTDNDVPVAFHGHRCACGCTLISSYPEASAS